MSKRRYWIYARRIGEKNWSEWCQVETLDAAESQCEIVRGLGYKAKVYDGKKKDSVIEDED